jgi:hypothetical protein
MPDHSCSAVITILLAVNPILYAVFDEFAPIFVNVKSVQTFVALVLLLPHLGGI